MSSTQDTTSPIQLSARLLRLPPYLFGSLNDLKYRKRQQGADIIDLGMGNPTDPPSPIIVNKLCESAQNPKNHRYSVSGGIRNLKKEIAKKYSKTWNVSLDPDTETICTIGSKEGFSHLCLALLGPGDTAVVPTPAFPIHIYSVAIAGANIIGVSQEEDEQEFLNNLVHVIERIHPKPKLLIINYPHNPTTRTVELAFFEEIYQIARKNNLMIVHDFAYAETVFDGYKAPSFLEVKGAKDIAVEFTTMSKPYNMAGWRVGFCAGNREIINGLSRIKGYYDYGMFTPIQIAAIIAMRQCTGAVKKQARIYARRRDVLVDGLNSIGWNIEKPRGTMFVWAPIPEKLQDKGSIELAMELMEKTEVAVSPGRGFGEDGEGYLRMALVENEERLKQAVRQIKQIM